MENHSNLWVLADLSTVEDVSTHKPNRVVAQLMDGWDVVGDVFDQYIERDSDGDFYSDDTDETTYDDLEELNEGEVPEFVYQELQDYAKGGVLCAFNLKKVYDDLLSPDWNEVGKEFSLERGFCLLRLTQRLLAPLPIQDNSLSSLRAFYNLRVKNLQDPLGRLSTVSELAQTVLRPIAETKRLTSVHKLIEYCDEVWYPAVLSWGKYKGQAYSEARDNDAMLDWLNEKAKSPNVRVSEMCRWYLDKLKQTEFPIETDELYVSADHVPVSAKIDSPDGQRHGIVLFENPELKQLHRLVEWVRNQLADIEKQHDHLRREIDKVQFVIREKLHKPYKRRDGLRLKVKYLQIRLDMYMHPTDATFEDIELEYTAEEEKLHQEYEKSKREAKQRTKAKEDPAEVNEIYRKLAKLYHPDLQASGSTRKSYEQLMKVINRARSSNNLKLLKEIAEDPRGYCLRNNIDEIEIEVDEDVEYFRKLYKHLQGRRFTALTELNDLKQSAGFQVYQHSLRQPQFMDAVAKDQLKEIERECEQLEIKREELQRELGELENE